LQKPSDTSNDFLVSGSQARHHNSIHGPSAAISGLFSPLIQENRLCSRPAITFTPIEILPRPSILALRPMGAILV